jgi:hypothetical protein
MLSAEGGAMSGTRGGLARIIAMGVALALALLLLAAKEATAGKYEVAQCGWHIGADANWADTTGGAKFRSDAYCATPPDADPFDGAHLKTFTRDGQQTVSGTRFGRWRWQAPAGTVITRVSGTWWHTLHDGFEQRIGADNGNGSLSVFAAASSTDVAPHDFVAGINPARQAVEDRLLCARAEGKWCSLDPGSWSAVRALTITVEDDLAPKAALGGDLAAGGWRRGTQNLTVWGEDTGGGVRFGEASLDGVRAALTEFPCAKEMIGGEWRATLMGPCSLAIGGTQTVATTNFSDGPHSLIYCVSDFAGNYGCTPRHAVLIDNNPPAHPRNLALAGGEGWRRVDDFDLAWANPDQGFGSSIGGASWRIDGPGFDTGVKFSGGQNLSVLKDLSVPRAGTYSLSIWLRDEAGNEDPASAISVPLRFDDVPPAVAFDPNANGADPDRVQVSITDAHSGPARGEIYYRRLDSQKWDELPAKFQSAGAPDSAQLLARVPSDLGPGTYVFRADAVDAAGNTASTTRRSDGTEMTVRKVPTANGATTAVAAVRGAEPARAKTRIFARLGWHGRKATELTVPFRASATLSGRLVDASGVGLASRMLRVISRPSRGALGRAQVDTVATGSHGGFRLILAAGTSRRIAVAFPGEERLEAARRRPLTLRVRGGVELAATPIALRTGEVVRFAGRVRSFGAPLPRRGKLVAIQYFESAAKRWRPILVTRTDHSGRFHVGYRFRYVSGVARIRLRAVALSEESWPYAPGASAPITLRVRG